MQFEKTNKELEEKWSNASPSTKNNIKSLIGVSPTTKYYTKNIEKEEQKIEVYNHVFKRQLTPKSISMMRDFGML